MKTHLVVQMPFVHFRSVFLRAAFDDASRSVIYLIFIHEIRWYSHAEAIDRTKDGITSNGRSTPTH